MSVLWKFLHSPVNYIDVDVAVVWFYFELFARSSFHFRVGNTAQNSDMTSFFYRSKVPKNGRGSSEIGVNTSLISKFDLILLFNHENKLPSIPFQNLNSLKELHDESLNMSSLLVYYGA